MARGRAGGRVPRRRHRSHATAIIHFSTGEQVAETAARHFAGIGDLVLVAVAAAALGPALKWEPSRGGALFPHLYGVLTPDAVLWVKPLPLGGDGRHIFPELDAVIGLFEALSRPLLRQLDAEDAHGLAILGLRFAPIFAARARRREPRGARLRAQLPQSGRHGGGFRQARRGAGRAAAARLRLRRGRHRDAAAAARQSAAAAVPPAGRRGRDQPPRLQQRRRGGGAAPARRARRSRRHRRRQCRRQQGLRRPHRRLCAPDRHVRAGRELLHLQHLVAQYAGPARPAAGQRVRRTDRARGRGARARQRQGRRDAGADQDRARPDAERSSTRWSRSRAAARSTA